MTLARILVLPLFLLMAACATQPQWNPDNSSRDLSIARVSYEYPKFEEPVMSDTDASRIASNRCSAWGFPHAEMIPGELRDCSVADGASCSLWKVTREYRCTGEGSTPQIAAR
ncbi:MAG TPA: YecR family lipoprotein [Steroidobacteraceae bacterium]|nr:YecR family lipoprotein [Steroidobacteraceae bacterium]